jgi:chitin disaccharide deacetylase
LKKLLIVNADDYGHTPGTSEGIRQAHLRGIVTSTSAMMNRPAVLRELEKAATLCPRLGTGVHLVLTSGQPILSPKKVPSLVQPDGRFFKLDGFVSHLDGIKMDQVRAEWNAQVELFIKTTGRQPDHLDSHHHSSYFTPTLFEEMLILAQDIGCPIRLPFNTRKPVHFEFIPEEIDNLDPDEMLVLLEKFAPPRTDFFFGNFYDENAQTRTVLDIFHTIRDSTVDETFELICHPAIPDEELRQTSVYNDRRGVELQVLIGPVLMEALTAAGIQLINFASLKEPS